MRYCLRRSLKLQEIVEACKEALIDVAEDEISSLGAKKTVNRVSVVTGIHRIDVARLSRSIDSAPRKSSGNIINRLIAQWQTDKRFLTAAGKPRLLSFDGKVGDFAELVRSVSADPNPYALLSEMERIDAIERTSSGRLKLKTPEYIISSDAKQTFEHLSRDNEDLISAVEQNLFLKEPDPNLHLRTEYDKIGKQFVPKIRQWLLREGSAFHARLRGFLSKFDEDTNDQLKTSKEFVRVSVCSFSRTETLDPSEPASENDAGKIG